MIMKKIEKLRLTEVSKQELTKRQLKDIKGGNPNCTQKCGYKTPPYEPTANNWISYF